MHRGFEQFFGTVCCPTTDWLYAYVSGDRIPIPPEGLLDRDQMPKHPWSFDNRPGMLASDFDLEEVDLVFLEKSQAFLKDHAAKHREEPFFLFHSMQAVHLPSFPSPRFQGKTSFGPHADFIFEMDHIVGELMRSLRETGMDQNTLVLFTSDNGPEVGTVIEMRERHSHDGASPWRGMKRDNWEGGHRVPTIAWWPGIIEAGQRSSQTICLTDVMATIAEIIDAELPDDAAEDSLSFLPLMKGKLDASGRPYTLHQTISLALAIRKGKWKYLHHQGSGGNSYLKGRLSAYALPNRVPNAVGQLYDLQADPGETTNLYDEYPEVVAELRQLLELSIARGRSVPRREVPGDSTTVDRLNGAGGGEN
jgi:arylsulfatase A-like enzyme